MKLEKIVAQPSELSANQRRMLAAAIQDFGEGNALAAARMGKHLIVPVRCDGGAECPFKGRIPVGLDDNGRPLIAYHSAVFDWDTKQLLRIEEDIEVKDDDEQALEVM